MKLRIRSKFIGILVVASLLPLSIALVTFNWFGEQYYRRSQGTICQTAASQLALSISRSLRHEIDLLDEWIDFADIGLRVWSLEGSLPGGPVLQASIDALDARWASLPEDAPEVAACLQNDLARQLREFQKRNPNFAEIIVTDQLGRLIAATNKTSDYWQADELWWQEAAATKAGAAYVEGLEFDESSGTHSISLSVPLFDPRHPDKPVGILKGVLNVMPFFQKIPPVIGHVQTVHEVVLGSGEILSRLGDPGLLPFKEKIPPRITRKLHKLEPGWGVEHFPGVGAVVIGFAPIGVAGNSSEDLRIRGLKPMWAVAYRDERAAMAPLRERMRMISLIGIGLAGVFVFIGYHIASKKIIAPINSLRRAAQAISRTVKVGEEPVTLSGSRLASRESSDLLRDVDNIRTGDEIEELAGEFAFMGQRILSYHEKLESEIAEKTGEIRRDLDFAKQFQANLMPRKYPEVPTAGQQPALGLNFHHIYRPASTVGGDFFNVLKLGDSKAGIFIADVMGHGARSALVTAIIATLLQDAEGIAGDPAEVLRMLNHHFYKVVHNTGDVVFVSAFYLVLDVAAMTATYASAGHPSPLLLDRGENRVVELTPHLSNNPALGLFENCTYEVFRRPIKERDLFLLFTDGLFECMNSHGEEFGRERLMRVVEEHRNADLNDLADLMVDAASAFAEHEGPADDVCLVGVEISQKSAARKT
ncbi:MAG: SpoIIE family protein phosphatase [Verrucomicrobiota bacterium]